MFKEKKPHNLRTILLALPRPPIRKKYSPPVYIPGKIDTGVRPSAVRGKPKENWRINMLSQPTQRQKVEKNVFVPETSTSTGVSPSALAGHCTYRTDHLSKPTMRYLIQNKKAYSFLGNPFIKNMDKTIKQSWNSIYNYYAKSLADLKKKRKAKRLAKKAKRLEGKKDAKGNPLPKPKSEKELREEREKRIIERCATLAIPNKIPRPDPLPPRKIANLPAMQERINQMAEPTRIVRKYVRPSIDSQYVDPFKVPESAKTYETSERMIELAKCPAHRLVKEPVYRPGAVKRSALTCQVSPRFAELAVPKKKYAEIDTDLKENPFQISPNAMKYVASARMQELAKPSER